MKIPYKLSLIILLLISHYCAFAQMTVEVRNFQAYDKAVFTAEIRTKINNNQTNVNLENILVLEKNYSTELTQIENLSDGWQKISWVPNFSLLENIYSAEILVSNGVNVAKGNVISDSLNLPQFILIYNNGPQKGQQVGDVYFGYVPVGKPILRQVLLEYYRQIKDVNGNTAPVYLDSVTHFNKNFRFKWEDLAYDQAVPRTRITGSELYYMNLYFVPVDDSYQYDVFIFHYHGGAKKTVKLFANNLKIDSKKQLELVYPNGGERLTPCQNIQIKWKGQVPGVPVIVEANFADSTGWMQLGEVKDSILNWEVPNRLSNNLQIRISQKFVNSNPNVLSTNALYLKVNYLNDASRFLAARDKGFIEEYDVNQNNKLINQYLLPARINYDVTNLAYLDNDKFFVSYNNYYLNKGIDTVAIFSSTQKKFLNKYLFQKYKCSNFVLDNKNNVLYAVPRLGNIITIISPLDGGIIQEITFDKPVQSLTINSQQNLGLLSFLNGEMRLFNLPLDANSKIISFKLDEVPISTNVVVSPNGKYAAISCKGYLGTKTQVVIVDLSKGTILAILREVDTEIVGMGFDPASSVLIFGNEALPQILFYDLAKSEVSIKFSNSTALLTDLKYSPVGNSIISTASGGDALVYRTFIKPEADLNDTTITIQEANVELLTYNNDDEFIFNSKLKTFQNVICNKGDSPIILTNLKLKNGFHFNFSNTKIPDTLNPNECRNIEINFNPKDTGFVSDTVIYSYCSRELKTYIYGTSKPRSISFYDNNFDFGEVCIGDTLVRNIEILRNNDNAPLRITQLRAEKLSGNDVYIFPIIDTILKPNEILKVSVKIVPDTFGIRESKIFVQMYNQDKYGFETKFKVKGIGTIINLNSKYLAFIPEIKKRKLTLENIGIDPVRIDAATCIPSDNFRVTTQFPFNIAPKQTGELEVEWYGNSSSTASLSLVATPCLLTRFIPLNFYLGSSLVEVMDTVVNPLDEASISLKYQNSENNSYNGDRFFESEMEVNPKLFFPLRVESTHGKGSLLSNEVRNGRRYFKIRVDGNFDVKNEVIARIVGIPGLADYDTTKVEFTNNSVYWGSAVKTTPKSGIFKIDAKCPGRKIIDLAPVKSLLIYPNPADETTTIKVTNSNAKQFKIKVINSLGIEVYSQENINLSNSNLIELKTAKIPIGAYKVLLEGVSEMNLDIIEGNLNIVR